MRIFIYFIVFFSFFDLFTQLPIMTPMGQALGATGFVLGLVVGIYSFSNLFGNVISGFLTDKYGPFYVLVAGLLSSAVALFLYTTVDYTITLISVRLLHGFTEGLIVPAAFTFIANRSEENKRGRNVAISGAFVGLAAIIGPAFGGIVSSIKSPAYVMGINGAIMLLLSGIAFLLLRKEIVKKKEKPVIHEGEVKALFQNPFVLRSFAGAFFLMFSQGVLALLLPLKVNQPGDSTNMSAFLFSTFGFVAVLIFLLPTNRIFDRVRPIITFTIGLSLMAVSMLLLGLFEETWILYSTMAIYGTGFALLFPSINSLLIDSTGEQVRGKAYGYFYGFFSIGVFVGSSIIGALNVSINTGFIITSIILFIVSGYVGSKMKRGFDNSSFLY